MAVDTLGWRMHVRWDEGAQATPNGQLVFFAEFLATAGIFERWVEDCPAWAKGSFNSINHSIHSPLPPARIVVVERSG